MSAWDIGLVRALNVWASASFWSGAVAVTAAESIVWIMGAILALATFWSLRRGRRIDGLRLAARALFAVAAGLTANWLFSLIWFRPRPFVAHGDLLNLVAISSGSKSFPSDHATAAFAMAFVAVSRWRLFAVLLPLAVIAACGRLAVGVHYPTDILAGAVAGGCWAYVASVVDRSPSVRRFWATAAKSLSLKV
jgi:undecaprenyl-diphosphatase